MSVVTTADLLGLAPVIPVVVLDEPTHAAPMAKALLAGGVLIIAVTLRRPKALDAIRAVATEVPDIVVDAGTVTSTALVDAAVSAGAQFLVTPGTTDKLWLRPPSPVCHSCPASRRCPRRCQFSGRGNGR